MPCLNLFTYTMLRPRFPQLSLLKLSSSSPFTRRAFASASLNSSQMTSFDERWKKLTQAEKDLVAKEYEHLQKGDWKSLTIDQKRIRKNVSLEYFSYL